MKRICALLLALILAAAMTVPALASGYTDIPAGSSLAGEIERAGTYGLMHGYSAVTFGYSDPMTRAQFVTVLVRMMPGWADDTQTRSHITDAMKLPSGLSSAYAGCIDCAAAHDVVDTDAPFRPGDAITRGEMAEMLVRALGLKSAAQSAEQDALPFTDVSAGRGYIAVAYAIGMTKGVSATSFAPGSRTTRAQAAAMLVRIYEKYTHATDWVHGFYAISSYGQLSLAAHMDALSAGWSRMTWDGTTALLSTTSANGNEYCVPSGYDSVVKELESGGKTLNLSVYMDNSGGLLAEMLASAAGRTQAVTQILTELTVSYKAVGKNPYSGVTVDFEGLRSGARADFNSFLNALSAGVHALGKTLYVTVQPVLTTGSYYDGYDYKTIGELADRVILMAHDYDPLSLSGYEGTEYYKNAALTPVAQVYEALRSATDASQGVQDPGKLVLAISCRAVAWKIDEADRLTDPTPIPISSATLCRRLAQSGTAAGFSSVYGNAYAVYTDESGQRYFVWYENTQSVSEKIRLARLFGVDAVSVWRLGNIPTAASVGCDLLSAIR